MLLQYQKVDFDGLIRTTKNNKNKPKRGPQERPNTVDFQIL